MSVDNQLKSHKLKVTPARTGVLKVFIQSTKPLSLTELQKSLPNFDLVTLYRTVATFTKHGLLRQLLLEEGKSRYELLKPNTHHHHLICQTCGKIVDISKCNTTSLEKAILKLSGFASLSHHSLEYFGLCKKCAKKTLGTT
ncbi:MAG TPA: Fur family transcriptional regulator [Patescibacteria group bacterium]|nr:Fur family transcriptional regulator [Patescibacteria group bacterium]